MKTNPQVFETNQQIKPSNKLTSSNSTNRLLPNQLTKLSLFILFLLAYSLQPTAYAADFAGNLKGVTITDSTGTNQPPVAVIDYTKSGGTVDFDANGSTDDGSIVEYRWEFGDGTTGNGVTASHQFTTGRFPVTLTLVDSEGMVALSQIIINISPLLQKAVNFQPSGTPKADGYEISDYGYEYDTSKGYGWNAYMPNVRDRNNVLSPDQAYDTLIMYIASSNVWEIDLPNGEYSITVCTGDPSFPSGLQKVAVEGVEVINGRLSYENKWIEQSINVGVADGRLTLTFPGGNETKICWVKITSV